ncbi:MAG: hypothetical protein ACO1N1_09105 [Dyadobacter fermentans]
MSENEKTNFIEVVFGHLKEAKSIRELLSIPEKCAIPKKYQLDSKTYPQIEFTLRSEDIGSLIKSGFLDSELNIASDINRTMTDPLAKLLYALAWKNGDLKKIKHIARGVRDVNDDFTDQKDALVFYQFGKYLTGAVNQPIVDQHVIRAFSVYRAIRDGIDPAEYLAIKAVTKKHKPIIDQYKNWLLSNELSSELKEENGYAFHIDRILFAAGKFIKSQKFRRSSDSKATSIPKVSAKLEEKYETCPELLEGDKYFNLQYHIASLKKRGQTEITVDLDFIERELGIYLNNTCFKTPSSFWSNGGWETNRQKRSWISQGYIVKEHKVDSVSRSGYVNFISIR